MRDPYLVDAVVEEVERDPSVSVRGIERRTGISKSLAHRILQQEDYHPYHVRKLVVIKSAILFDILSSFSKLRAVATVIPNHLI
ncbi:unnamed protein product, partial [Brenthis ino]